MTRRRDVRRMTATPEPVSRTPVNQAPENQAPTRKKMEARWVVVETEEETKVIPLTPGSSALVSGKNLRLTMTTRPGPVARLLRKVARRLTRRSFTGW